MPACSDITTQRLCCNRRPRQFWRPPRTGAFCPRRSSRFSVRYAFTRVARFGNPPVCTSFFTVSRVPSYCYRQAGGPDPARGATMKQSEVAKCDDDLVYRVVELLFKERGEDGKWLKMEAIAQQVEEEFGENLELTRESLYPLVREAVRRSIVQLTPPINRHWRDKLVQKFSGLAGAKVNVVRTRGRDDTAKVAEVAAEKAFKALLRIAKAKNGEPVGLGLGPGRATLEFCRLLNDRLKFVRQGLKLRLVAITAGCPATLLENAPISFLNLLPEHLVERKLGLFAETLVRGD